MKVKLRFPNDMFFDEVNIEPKDFKPNQEFDKEVFGDYLGVHVSMDIESYNKIKDGV